MWLRSRVKTEVGSHGSAPHIDADLAGAVIQGQAAVGEHIVQIHAEHGAIVNFQAPQERPVARARATPVRRLPRAFDGLLGREELVAAAVSALRSGVPVGLVGRLGIGKSAILRHLSHRLDGLEPDGIVYTAWRRQPADDLLQFLFESFYESETVIVATAAELSHYLHERRAVIVVDDAELDRDELGRVMNIAAACTFLTASMERHLWGEGQSVTLAGLDDGAALALLERELGRELMPTERPAALRCCQALGCSPLRIVQTAGLLRAGMSLRDLPGEGATAAAEGTLTRMLASSLSVDDGSLLALVAALGGVPVPAEVVAAVSGVADTPERLRALEVRGLVQAHSPSYTVTEAPA